MIYIQKKAASSWSSFKKKTDTGGGEKRYFLGPPTDQDIISLELVDNGKDIKLIFDGSQLVELRKLFSQFEYYRYVKASYCYPEARNDINEDVYQSMLDAYQEILAINETYDGKITNDGSRVYIVSSVILKKISQVCPPEISGIIITHLNDNIYNLFVYFDSDFLNRFNLQINFFNFPSSLKFIELPVAFHQKASESGLLFSIDLVKRFIASLCTKPFLICSGLSGSGKTKLAQAFAQWISFDTSQYLIVPVGADWTNREPLLGYSNALVSDEYVYPENGALNLILRAKENYDQYSADSKTLLKPYFLILDEMNLSHVERYFADFLSSMESGDSIPLHKITNEKKGIPGNVNLPKNLFIIGTVNIDETTYMFSPKVLDRANTIEFRITETELNQYIDNEVKLDLNVLKNQGSNLSGLFMSFAILETERNLRKSKNDLNLFFNELKKFGAEFGFRTASEIGRLMKMLELLGNDKDSLLDIAIMQKLLPKLHGSRSKLNATLVTLAKFCVQDALKEFEGKDDDFKKLFFKPIESLQPDQLNRLNYKVSFEKIVRMHKNALENGFTSYAEA
jgi:hypothetical protein